MTTTTLHRTHEIIELTEDYDHESKLSTDVRKKHSFEDDINKFFEAIEIGSSRRGIGHKSAMKRPMRVGPSHASGIGISESVSLKQALRGLCISQASEMAAVKKRISRPSASPGLSDLGASKKLYIEASEGQKGNFMEISFVPKRAVASKNRSQHSEGLKKDVDYETSKIVHPTPNPISEKGCEKLEKTNKGEFSQSSKSSIGEYSTTTSYSDDSYLSGSSRNGYRPHMSKDSRWEAITSIQKHHGKLGMKHFKLLRKIGGGDIATVYLAELIETSCLFAVKVIDNEYLSSRKKLQRAQTEKEILEILDHPFLPTLFAHFTTNKFSCLVMEYCPGGDLHVLRQKQPTKSFPEKAARFYAAEILLALEYLHMLGVVYRDLKPENILVREDGHIMLSDFDLSLRCTANHTLLNSSPKKISDSSCIDPFCLQPSWQLSCFTPKFLTRKVKSDLAAQIIPLPQLVVEPTTARSNSFVGTHEYLAPEIIKGEGHGSAVDWWTFGVFFYELLYGSTPFKGSSNDETISNVVSRCVEFPRHPTVSSHARDLIRRLLKKEPENRLGSAKGAAEIKQHPFFEGLNWALIRCETPPELPKLFDAVLHGKESKQASEFEQRGDEMEFEMF